MNFSKIKNVYLIGIKGVGMAMLAQFLQAKSYNVFGSDVKETFPTDKTLKYAKIKFKSGFSLNNFPEKIDLVIHSSAFTPQNNIELKYFLDNKYPVLVYAEALGHFFNQHLGIAVCGSHGKTTVTSWLGFVMSHSGKKPNVLTGSYVKQFKGSALIGDSSNFIIEADEYQNKLRFFKPHGVVLNNIDFDHPDYFKTKQQYFQVFSDFVQKIPKNGFLITNAEDNLSVKVAQENKGVNIFYSISDLKLKSDIKVKKIYQAKNIRLIKGNQIFELWLNSKKIGDLKIVLPGRHNILNALAVSAGALELGVDFSQLKKNLVLFKGAARRFDVLGTYKGAVIIDDYAHHPSEVKASLQAVSQRYPDKRIITVFHPHTFSRTKALINDFATSFSMADKLYVIEIYSSARESASAISSLDLIKKIKAFNQAKKKRQEVKYFKDLDEAEKYLPNIISQSDVVLLLGAGDIFRVGYHWLKIK